MKAATQIRTKRLTLETLRIVHARSLLAPLRDDAIYRFIEERPPKSLAALKSRYRFLARGRSPRNRSERWLNWAIRLRAPPRYIGFVQATVLPRGDAYVGYVVSPRWWGRGLGREAVEAMLAHLRLRGARRFVATVEADNARSVALLQRLGFRERPAAAPRAGERTFVLGDNPGGERTGER